MSKGKERNYTSQELSIMKSIRNTRPHICEYCGKLIINENKVTLDHLLPIDRGGKTEQQNLCITCTDCNNEKDNMTKEEYLEFLEIKKDILKGNCNSRDSLITINNLINTYETQINKYDELLQKLGDLGVIIADIQITITNENFNASRGYCLCKKLQESLQEQETIKTERKVMASFVEMAKKQIDLLRNERNKMLQEEIRLRRNKFARVNKLLKAV